VTTKKSAKPSTASGKAKKPAAPKQEKKSPKEVKPVVAPPAPAPVASVDTIVVEGVKNGYNRNFTTNVDLRKKGEFVLLVNNARQSSPGDYSIVSFDGTQFRLSIAPSLSDRIEVRRTR